MPVPPLPTEEELEEKKKAKEALSEKLKGRTRRTAVQQLLGSGSLHSFNERTIVDHDAQLLPNAYDWTWRQKKFRPEEQFKDRLDRMIGNMVDEDNDRLHEQLSKSREEYAEKRKKELLTASLKGGSSVAKAMRIRSSFATGGGRTLRSGKKTRFADDSDTDSEDDRTPQPIRSRPLDTQTLASDIALFMDRDDEPAAMIRDLNGYFDDEKVDAAEVIDLLVDKMDESEDENSEDEIEEPYDPSDVESLIDPADEPDYDVTEALDPVDDALLDDYYAAEWLDLMLEDSVNDIFARASSRAGSSSGAEFDLLRRRVFNEIQQEFATRLWLEDEQVWGKAKPMSLAPFENEFGPSFGKTIEAATSGVGRRAFAKMARIKKKKYRPNRPGRRPGVDVSGPMDLFNNNDVAPPGGSDTEPSSSESESESESSESEDEVIVVQTDKEKQQKDTEDLLKAIQAALLKGGGDDIDEVALQQLRGTLGPDWKRRFTDVFRESNGQKGGTKTKTKRKNIKDQATEKKPKQLTRGRYASPEPPTKRTTKTEEKKPIKEDPSSKPTKTKKEEEKDEKKDVKKDVKDVKKDEKEEDEDEKDDDDDDDDDSDDDSDDDDSDDDSDEEEDEVKDPPSPYKTEPAFQNIQLDPNKSGSGRSWNPTKPRSQRTRPPRWDKSTQPGFGQAQAREVNKDLDMDAQGYHAQAEKNERDWVDQRRKIDRQSHHRTSNDRVMQPHHYFGYNLRSITVPAALRKGQVMNPKIDPQDAYVLSKAKPDGADWGEDQIETDGVDTRADAHDGAKIDVEDDEEEEEEQEEEEVITSVPAKRARTRRGGPPARSVKRRKIDDAQRLIDEIAALEASIWDPASLPRYAPSAYPLAELLEQYGRIAAAFDRLSFGADDTGGFWSLQREKIQYISAALSYRGALERGDDVLPDFGGFGSSSSASASAYSTDEESEVAAQLEGAHEYRLGTGMQNS